MQAGSECGFPPHAWILQFVLLEFGNAAKDSVLLLLLVYFSRFGSQR